MLGILDKAILTLGTNVQVNFSKVIVIMTSNLGAKQMYAKKFGFDAVEEAPIDDGRNKTVALEAAKRHFTPEFMNRIDHIVTFNTLTKEHIREIMMIELGLIQRTMLERAKFVYQLTPAAKDKLMEEGYSVEYGARDMKRAIERRVRLPLARLVSSGQIAPGSAVVIDEIGTEKFEFSVQKLLQSQVTFQDVKDILEGKENTWTALHMA